MKSQAGIRIIIPILLVIMAGTGKLAGQMWPGMGLCLPVGPSLPGVDQQINSMGKDRGKITTSSILSSDKKSLNISLG